MTEEIKEEEHIPTEFEKREAWVAKRLEELKTEEVDELGPDLKPTGKKLKAKKAVVVRGSLGDAIGIQTEY